MSNSLYSPCCCAQNRSPNLSATRTYGAIPSISSPYHSTSALTSSASLLSTPRAVSHRLSKSFRRTSPPLKSKWSAARNEANSINNELHHLRASASASTDQSSRELRHLQTEISRLKHQIQRSVVEPFDISPRGEKPSRRSRAQKEIVGVVKEVGEEMLKLQSDMADDARWRQQQLLLPARSTIPLDTSTGIRGSTSLINIVSRVSQGVTTTLRVSSQSLFFYNPMHSPSPPPKKKVIAHFVCDSLAGWIRAPFRSRA